MISVFEKEKKRHFQAFADVSLIRLVGTLHLNTSVLLFFCMHFPPFGAMFMYYA